MTFDMILDALRTVAQARASVHDPSVAQKLEQKMAELVAELDKLGKPTTTAGTASA